MYSFPTQVANFTFHGFLVKSTHFETSSCRRNRIIVSRHSYYVTSGFGFQLPYSMYFPPPQVANFTSHGFLVKSTHFETSSCRRNRIIVSRHSYYITSGFGFQLPYSMYFPPPQFPTFPSPGFLVKSTHFETSSCRRNRILLSRHSYYIIIGHPIRV